MVGPWAGKAVAVDDGAARERDAEVEYAGGDRPVAATIGQMSRHLKS